MTYAEYNNLREGDLIVYNGKPLVHSERSKSNNFEEFQVLQFRLISYINAFITAINNNMGYWIHEYDMLSCFEIASNYSTIKDINNKKEKDNMKACNNDYSDKGCGEIVNDDNLKAWAEGRKDICSIVEKFMNNKKFNISEYMQCSVYTNDYVFNKGLFLYDLEAWMIEHNIEVTVND